MRSSSTKSPNIPLKCAWTEQSRIQDKYLLIVSCPRYVLRYCLCYWSFLIGHDSASNGVVFAVISTDDKLCNEPMWFFMTSNDPFVCAPCGTHDSASHLIEQHQHTLFRHRHHTRIGGNRLCTLVTICANINSRCYLFQIQWYYTTQPQTSSAEMPQVGHT